MGGQGPEGRGKEHGVSHGVAWVFLKLRSHFSSLPFQTPPPTWLFYCLLTKKHLVFIIGKFYYQIFSASALRCYLYKSN